MKQSIQKLSRRIFQLSVFVPPLLLGACNQEQEPLTQVDPLAKVNEQHSTPPDRFRRTDITLKGEGELTVKAEIEEVMHGVRLAVRVRNAEPGNYEVAAYESGTCDKDPSLWGKPFLFSGIESTDTQNETSALGPIEVMESGNGNARWLTARGNLRDTGNDSLVGKPIALYRRGAADGSNKILACGMIEVELD